MRTSKDLWPSFRQQFQVRHFCSILSAHTCCLLCFTRLCGRCEFIVKGSALETEEAPQASIDAATGDPQQSPQLQEASHLDSDLDDGVEDPADAASQAADAASQAADAATVDRSQSAANAASPAADAAATVDKQARKRRRTQSAANAAPPAADAAPPAADTAADAAPPAAAADPTPSSGESEQQAGNKRPADAFYDDPGEREARDDEGVRKLMKKYVKLSKKERIKRRRQTGIKYSPFFKLKYFDVVQHPSVDFCHALFLVLERARNCSQVFCSHLCTPGRAA